MSLLLNKNLERWKKLKAKLELVPQNPGVYIHKNDKEEILYVGKAKNLKARLKSYFTSVEQHSLKTKALVEKIDNFEIIVTENEYESLLLENNLIKHNLPPYNILLRDDKTYPYIKIDKHEEWPRVILTRRRKKDGALYFGPYTIAGQINQVLSIINRFFPLVKCTPSVFNSVSRPCNYYDIKKCLGPCKLPIDKKEYNKHLENVIEILNGNVKQITKKLKEEMHLVAENLDFEKAALLRDQFKSLSHLSERQSVTLDFPIYMDMISFYWSNELIVFYISFIRNGKLVGGNSFIIKDILYEPNEENDDNIQEKICSSFICQYYSKKEIPDFIFLSQANTFFSKLNHENIEKFLNNSYISFQSNREDLEKKQRDEIHPNIHNNKKNIHFEIEVDSFLKKIKSTYNISKILEYKKIFSDIIQLSINNAKNKAQEQSKMDENSIILLNDAQKLLGLTILPRYIECFDISTFQGAQTVASQVAFKDGVPYKNGYKKYIIKDNLGKTDDFASLREVIRRRFKHLENTPDLIVIDGGTPQIREVGWTLKSLGLENIPFIGLAKSRVKNNFDDINILSSQERIIIPYKKENGELDPSAPCEILTLKEGSPAFRLFTQLRDEAHRFAIQFHRKKRDAASIKSILFDIPGLGAKRRKQLLEICPDLKELISANLNELSKKTKVPLNVLMTLKEKLEKI